MFTRQNLVRLILAGLLLALLAFPVLGAALDSGFAANNNSHDSTLVHQTSPTESSGLAIACIPDPSGGQGTGC